MARPRKKRKTQLAGSAQNAAAKGVTKTNSADRTPKSMVIRMGAGEVGPSVTQLVKDVRTVMEPHTAVRLKERRSNKLKDYTTMAGPLGVTHFLLFSRSDSGNTNMRLAITPRGPTLNFRVEKYSLCKDIVKSQKRPKNAGGNVEHLTPPLLVMNNFTTPKNDSTSTNPSDDSSAIPKHLENLTTTVFQSLFPAISPQTTPLASIRRVLLLNRITRPSDSDGKYTLQFRHYAISTRPVVHLSRGLKRLKAIEKHALSSHHASKLPRVQPAADIATAAVAKKKDPSKLPDLSRLDDVAEYLLDPGYVSASDTDALGSGADTDAEVEVLEAPAARKVLNRKQMRDLREQREREQRDEERKREEDREGSPDSDSDEEMQESKNEENSTAKPATARAAAGKVSKRAIRLHELGPRLTLRLVKVEEGLCEGKVMWHEHVTKSRDEEAELEKRWEEKRREKEERRRVQKENLDRKRAELANKKGRRRKEGDGDGEDAQDAIEESGDDQWNERDDEELLDLDDEGVVDALARRGDDEDEDDDDEEMELDGEHEAEAEFEEDEEAWEDE